MRIIQIKIIVVLLMSLLSTTQIFAQVKVSEVLQESPLSKTESNKLYFVDFWATWCGPCVYAKKYLTVLQRQFPEDFYIISISEENPVKVERFLKINPTELTIAVDDNSYMHQKYGITSLPQGILFNAKGEVLWQGSSASLKPEIISRYLASSKKRKSFTNFVKVTASNDKVERDYQPKSPIEIKVIKEDLETIDVYESSTYMRYKGELSDILSHLSKTYKGQIELAEKLNKTYEIYLQKPLDLELDYGRKVLGELKYNVTEKKAEGLVYTLKVKKPNFWDINQIQWAKGQIPYLISDSEIMANDMSLKDMSYLLAKYLELPVVISFGDKKKLNEPHDWQVHYKYFELMQSNLLDYGIEVTKTEAKFPKYYITKKAP